MRLLYIITLPDLGGAQMHLLEVACSMKARGASVFVLVGKKGWLTDRLSENEIEYMIINNLVRNICPIKDLAVVKDICKVIQANRPDIVHCHSSKAGIVGRIAAWLEHVPSVFTAHGWAFTEGVPFIKRFFYSIIEHIMLGLTTKTICVSEYDKRLAEKWFFHKSKKLVCIHNGIKDKDYLTAKKDKKNIFSDELNLVMVGRFSVPKKHFSLLKVVEMILKKYPDSIHLLLVGDGELFSKTEKYVYEHKLEKHVELLGSRNDVAEILANSDVFALISDYEGLPISIIEGMRAGLPIIASDVGGVKELVQEGINGFLIEKGNQKQLEEKLVIFINDKIKRIKYGKQSRERYEKEFSSDMMLNEIERVYKQILN